MSKNIFIKKNETATCVPPILLVTIIFSKIFTPNGNTTTHTFIAHLEIS